jgi:AcrR family transcriptional regulator
VTSAVPAPVILDDSSRSRDDGAKRRQIMDGAREVFLAGGFDAASMNEIARVAGVSKGTLYVYFDSKEALFAALIREEKREQAEQTCRLDFDNTDIETVLRQFGERLVDRMLRPSSIAHLRTVAAVAAKFPSIGLAFYEAGPQYGQQRLSQYFKKQIEAGLIEMDDPWLGAVFFSDLCKSVHLLPVLLCVEEPPSTAAIAAHIKAVCAMFLRAYPLKAKP